MTNGVIVLTTALAATALTAPAHWMGPGGYGFPWFLIFVPLFWFLVLGLVFALVGRRWRRSGGPGYGPYAAQGARSAESTLAERFAKGDIEEVEYRARLEVLRANSSPGR
jgi:putative membrane protein